jgi:hypothetical protein
MYQFKNKIKIKMKAMPKESTIFNINAKSNAKLRLCDSFLQPFFSRLPFWVNVYLGVKRFSYGFENP